MLHFSFRTLRNLQSQKWATKIPYPVLTRPFQTVAESVASPSSLLGTIASQENGEADVHESVSGQWHILRKGKQAVPKHTIPQQAGRKHHLGRSSGANAIPDEASKKSHLDENFFTKDSTVTELQIENSMFEEPIMDSLHVSQEHIEEMQSKISALLSEDGDEVNVARMSELLDSHAVIASLKTTSFLEILRWLEPRRQALPLRPEYADRLRKDVTRFQRITDHTLRSQSQRKAVFKRLCGNRALPRRPFTLPEYKQMLQCARAMYDAATVFLLIKKMLRANVKPDLTCYNAFFAALCWSDAWHPLERQRLRVFRHTIKQREGNRSIRTRTGHQLQPYRVGTRGLMRTVTKAFNDMVENGIVADREAFEHVLIAFAREGDIECVKMVLKNAWDLDVNATTLHSTNSLRRDSPMYPEQSTLFAIAHAFGINNDVPTALQAVLMCSNVFSIPIGQHVWSELLECTYILSTSRHKNRKWDGAQLGQLPKQLPLEIWRILSGEPYECVPTRRMCDIMVCSMARSHRLIPMIEYIQKALAGCHSGIPQEVVDEDETKSMVGYMGRWFKLLLYHQWRFFGTKSSSNLRFMQREIVPDVVDIFWPYKHDGCVTYSMETGRVQLKARPLHYYPGTSALEELVSK